MTSKQCAAGKNRGKLEKGNAVLRLVKVMVLQREAGTATVRPIPASLMYLRTTHTLKEHMGPEEVYECQTHGMGSIPTAGNAPIFFRTPGSDPFCSIPIPLVSCVRSNHRLCFPIFAKQLRSDLLSLCSFHPIASFVSRITSCPRTSPSKNETVH